MKSRAATHQRHVNGFRALPSFSGFLPDFTKSLHSFHCICVKLLMDRNVLLAGVCRMRLICVVIGILSCGDLWIFDLGTTAGGGAAAHS